jgi:hypothetical protein
MKRDTVLLILRVVLILSAATPAVIAQHKARPVIVRVVRPEIARDSSLESAIIDALYEDDESGVSRDRVRYYYNRVDLNADGQTEVLVYLFGTTWCGSAGCAALVFQSVGSKYKLVTHISGVENPIIVSGHRTNGWNDLIAHVRWGEVRERTLRDYYAVLRFGGHTYPDQFPGASPLNSRRRVPGTAYLVGDQSSKSGLALRAGVR